MPGNKMFIIFKL